MNKFNADLKQYGFFGYQKRVVKGFLRRIGIDYESYYYMVNTIDYDKQKHYWDSHMIAGCRELTLQDYALSDPEWYTESKKQLYTQRLGNGYKAYGVVENDRLIYSCMLSFNEFITSQKWLVGTLNPDESLMVDAYCAPEGRGRGIHGAMNAYRLMQSVKNGRPKCVAIVLKENIPAYKSQLKVGYKVMFKYYTLTLFGKHFTNFYKLKANAS